MDANADTTAYEPPHAQITRMAVRTLVAVQIATLAVYTFDIALLFRFRFVDIVATGIAMIAGNIVVAAPLFLLLLATLRWTGSWRRPLLWLSIVATAAAQSVSGSIVKDWTGVHAAMVPGIYEGAVRAFPVNLYNTALWVVLIGFQATYITLGDQGRLLGHARAGARASQLAALRFQINPHFLFNALNALSSLVVVGRTRQAEEMIERLSAFLRATLTSDGGRTATLEEEFETIDAYLAIERVRFGDRLAVVLELPRALSGIHVPSLLLQPLVENAVKYGVAPSRRPVTLAVAARRAGDAVIVTVTDDGEDCEGVDGGTGVGLANVRERLQLAYGPAAAMDAGCRKPHGFEVVLTIPAATHAPPAPRAAGRRLTSP